MNEGETTASHVRARLKKLCECVRRLIEVSEGRDAENQRPLRAALDWLAAWSYARALGDHDAKPTLPMEARSSRILAIKRIERMVKELDSLLPGSDPVGAQSLVRLSEDLDELLAGKMVSSERLAASEPSELPEELLAADTATRTKLREGHEDYKRQILAVLNAHPEGLTEDEICVMVAKAKKAAS